MKGPNVHAVLRQIGAVNLHHANSVATSCTFLQQGGLVSRGFAEHYKLPQTPQMSDDLDKRYHIWHCLFLDHVDIHFRGGRTKGPNLYGPVLFVLDLDVLLNLPPETNVFVTKTNPTNWWDGQPDAERWFQSPEELAAGITFGDFHKMLVIETPSRKLDFPDRRVKIYLDDPQRQISSGVDAYSHAKSRLAAAAMGGKVTVSIDRHVCRQDCTCIERYASYDQTQGIDFFFN